MNLTVGHSQWRERMSAIFSKHIFVLSLALLAVSSARVFAQGTPEERSACMGDAFQFCAADIPDVQKIEACLMRNINRLQPGCRAEFQPSGRTKIRSDHFR